MAEPQAAAERRVVLIPVRSTSGDATGEVVEVALDDTFPADAQELIEVLAAESAAPGLWLRVGLEYLRRGHPAQMEAVLREGSERSGYPRDESERAGAVGLHSTLAAYYAAESAQDKKRRTDLQRRATAELNAAEAANIHDWNSWLAKGLLYIAKGELESAQRQFENVLEPSVAPGHTGATLGKACVHFGRGEYREARDLLRRALETNPACPPCVRVALAHTYWRLGRADIAAQWLRRALEVDPRNVEAIAALAVLEINAGHIQPAMQQLKAAYQVSPRHPVVLNHLANHLFYKGEVHRALEFATAASEATQIEKLRAESYYIIARSHHKNGAYDTALKFYNMSTMSWPEFPLAQYGLGQMHIHKGELDKAVACFESVLKAVPGNYEATRVLGSLYLQLGRRALALSHLRTITSNPGTAGDPHAWAELAHLALTGGESGDAPDLIDALRHYDRARQMLRDMSEQIPPEYHNNAGVAQFYLGRLDEATAAFKDAIAASGVATEAFAPENVTATFNLARVYEATCQLPLAESLYKGILKEHPNYVACYMRLGMMAREKGLLSEAADWLKLVFSVNKTHKDAWSMMGLLHVEKGEWQPAQKKFEQVMELCTSDGAKEGAAASGDDQSREQNKDAFAQVALGTVFHAAMRREHDAEKAAKFLRHAYDYFRAALKSDPSNAYAALGIGVVLAEHGEHAAAAEIFADLRQTLTESLEPAVNCAHALMRLGHTDKAVAAYEACLRRWRWSPGDGQQLLLYLANAYFVQHQWKDCRRVLQQALLVTPNNSSIWHALANALEATASAELEANPQTSAGLAAAVSDLKVARQLFKWQSKDAHAESCDRKQRTASERLPVVAAKEAEDIRAREEEKRRRAEELEKRRQEEESKRRAEEERHNRMREMAQRAKEAAEDVIAAMQEEAARKRAAAQAKADAEAEGSGAEKPDEAEGGAGSYRQPASEEEQDLFGDADDDDKKKKKHKRRHASAENSGSSGDESARKRAKKEKKKLKKRHRQELEAAAAAAAAGNDDQAPSPSASASEPVQKLSRLHRADRADDDVAAAAEAPLQAVEPVPEAAPALAPVAGSEMEMHQDDAALQQHGDMEAPAEGSAMEGPTAEEPAPFGSHLEAIMGADPSAPTF
eukprot:m51a1_g11834 hypothetical protein (1133) ;mRNA; f:445374-448969